MGFNMCFDISWTLWIRMALLAQENVHMYEMAFEQQYHFGIFYAWVKLREQEIRNIRWDLESM